jgi:DNA (cytosine-5)-methyltransferase 1
MTKLRVLDLFSGIGGFSLGLERTGGFETVAFCEINPFCRKVLAKHWPKVRQYEDVRELTAERLAADGIAVDVICGGFPCQDISSAGTGAGIEGERSGLWSEIARLAGELRPQFVIVENVAALLGRGLDRVLGDLAALGFDAEWHCIPASAVGAPHRRDRIWIVAYPGHIGGQTTRGECSVTARANSCWGYDGSGSEGDAPREVAVRCARENTSHVADPECGRLQSGHVERAGASTIVPAAFGRHCGGGELGSPWRSEPELGRVAYGLPNQVDRLRALGNAVVPQIPELIGRAILAAEQRSAA